MMMPSSLVPPATCGSIAIRSSLEYQDVVQLDRSFCLLHTGVSRRRPLILLLGEHRRRAIGTEAWMSLFSMLPNPARAQSSMFILCRVDNGFLPLMRMC